MKWNIAGFKSVTSAVLVFPLLLSGCAFGRSKQSGGTPLLSASVQEEIAIGEKIHSHILSSFYPYTQPKVTAYVDKIGQSLAQYAVRKELTYRFTIL